MSKMSTYREDANPFVLGGSSPPKNAGNKLENIVEAFESAYETKISNEQFDFWLKSFTENSLQIKGHVKGTLTQPTKINYQSHRETADYKQIYTAANQTYLRGSHMHTEAVPKGSGSTNEQGRRLMSVKDFCNFYSISKGAIYALIKTDSSFPIKNVGLKKKFMIEMSEYDAWLTKRSDKDSKERFSAPSAHELLNLFKGKP